MPGLTGGGSEGDIMQWLKMWKSMMPKSLDWGWVLFWLVVLIGGIMACYAGVQAAKCKDACEVTLIGCDKTTTATIDKVVCRQDAALCISRCPR